MPSTSNKDLNLPRTILPPPSTSLLAAKLQLEAERLKALIRNAPRREAVVVEGEPRREEGTAVEGVEGKDVLGKGKEREKTGEGQEQEKEEKGADDGKTQIIEGWVTLTHESLRNEEREHTEKSKEEDQLVSSPAAGNTKGDSPNYSTQATEGEDGPSRIASPNKRSRTKKTVSTSLRRNPYRRARTSKPYYARQGRKPYERKPPAEDALVREDLGLLQRLLGPEDARWTREEYNLGSRMIYRLAKRLRLSAGKDGSFLVSINGSPVYETCDDDKENQK